jgi:hypothetical protein
MDSLLGVGRSAFEIESVNYQLEIKLIGTPEPF